MVDVTDSKSVGGDTVWVRVPPPAPRRSSLRTARKRQAQKRLPFPHLCSVTPPSQIGPVSLGSDLDIGKRASERMPAFWCRACGAVLSASLKRERGLPSPLALFPCKLDTRFGFELPRCTMSELTPHGSEKAGAKALAFSSSMLRGSSFPNRTRCAGLRFGY